VYVHNKEVFEYHYHHLQMKFVQVNSIIIQMKFVLLKKKYIKNHTKSVHGFGFSSLLCGVNG
jgi:hypothetical protein